MLPRWSFRYGAYQEEEDWDLNTLGVVNSQLKMYLGRLPGGPGDLTLAELQEMATRQQQQMEAQQQVLVAKEQRLKYLKQQEARHAQLASESERLRKIRERVESQELKLKKLRALRGQAEQYRTSNGQLNSELDAVKAVFNEKEKELAMAVARVDQLTRQLKDLRNGKANTGLSGQKHEAAALELEKLRKELILRNKLNEQQTNSIAAKEKLLHQKQDEVKNMDNRILELQQRLKKRKLQEDQNSPAYKQAANNHNEQNKENANVRQTNPVSVNRNGDPYIQYAPRDVVKDDSYSQSGHFIKQDPKYQTLPVGVRLGHPNVETRGSKPQYQDASDNRDSQGDYNLPVVLPLANNQTKPGYNHNTSHHHLQQQQHQHPHQQRQHPEMIQPPPPGKPQKFNNNDFSKPNQNYTNLPPAPSAAMTSTTATSSHPQPIPSQRPLPPKQQHMDQSNNNNPPTSSANKFFPPSNTPRGSSSSSMIMGQREPDAQRKGVGGGGGPLSSLHPVISIHEEERQAGSGQSSPASSEGSSNSSGGIQIKDEAAINETPIGPVSAMIDRLNKGNKDEAKTSPTSSSSAPPQFPPPSAKVTGGQSGQTKPAPEGVSTFLANNNNKHPQQQQHPFSRSSESTHFSSGVHQQDNHRNSSSSRDGRPDSMILSGGVVQNNDNNPVPSSPSQLTGPPQLNVKPAPTYRYASKNQIANTYMGRLGGAAMERYQQNLNKLYKNLEAQDARGDGSSISNAAQGSGPGTNGQDQGDGETAFGSVSPHDYPDIASDKGSYKLNTPKQVRRRHSDGESDEVNKALQDRQDQEAKEQQQADDDESTAKPSKDKDATSETPGVNSKSKQSDPSSSSTTPASSVSTSSPASSSTTTSTSSSSTSTSLVSSKSPPDSQDAASIKKLSKVESVVSRRTKSNLKKDNGKRRSNNRVSFDPLALLLDGSLEGELDLVKKVAVQVDDVSTPNDEGITALHNAICAGHYEIVKFLIEFGCDVNSPDSDGWTPLHCAASCNNLPMVRFLVEHGACVFATTISDQETAADKCEEDEDGYDGCSDYLYSIQEKLGITNAGDVYAVFDYTADNGDELTFVIGDRLTVLRKGDETEKEWWWARLGEEEGYIPRNLLGLYPRVLQQPSEVSEC